MKNTVEVKGLIIGEGQPKICVPVTAENIEEIKKQAHRVMLTPADLVEWRVDYLKKCTDIPSVMVALDKLTDEVSDKPVLFTFRTAAEGGLKAVSGEEYSDICRAAIETGKIDLIDLEYYLAEDVIRPLMELAASRGVRVILSNHDFKDTPTAEEMTGRLKAMKDAGADIAKIAVMPHNPADVLALLTAAENMRQVEDPIPVVAISMSGTGLISRIAGEAFGSAITFASSGKGSAPGQIDADDLDRCLCILHQNMTGTGPSAEGYEADTEGDKADKEKKNIILIGFMGTGKSTIARKIQEKAGYDIKEMDEIIESDEGMTITEMFGKFGEKYFRDKESSLVETLAGCENIVVSCGGGTVLRQENVSRLKSTGRIILLRAKADTVYERVRWAGDKRPLLNRFLSRGYISWMMKKRSGIYADAADFTVDVDGKTADTIAEEILDYMGIGY